MKFLPLALPVLLPLTLWAQKPAGVTHGSVAKPDPYASVDARAMQWPDSVTGSVTQLGAYVNGHFATPTEKTRAIFVWIANNIQYDIDNMFAINFYEDAAEKIAKPLRTRKGICENYASLFAAVCGQAGIPCVVVVGYTRVRGFVDYVPHAWCAAYLDGAWSLFDPTWGSGYIDNNKKFVRKLDEEYFKASPEAFIRSHMPFDYLWQCLYYPVTNQEFYEGKTAPDKTKPYFNYPDSIKAYEALGRVEQETAEVRRIQQNGLRNSMLFDRLHHLEVDLENAKRQAEADRQDRLIEAYNTALGEYNSSSRQFNSYINYFNAQFKPARPDAEIQQMLDSADRQAQAAKAGADAIVLTPADSRIQQPLKQLKGGVEDLAAHIREQQEWLTRYFSKGKFGRKTMFHKYTWFGVPLN
jgi:transglutaminase superfamily protein